MRQNNPFVVSVFLCLGGLAFLLPGCTPYEPVELDNPLADIRAAAGQPVDGMTTPSIESLSFSYLPLSPEDMDTSALVGSVIGLDGEPAPPIDLPAANEAITSTSLMQLPPRGLSLKEAIALTFENSLNVQIQELNYEIADDRINQEYGIFDTMITAGADWGRARRPLSVSRFDPQTGKEIDQKKLEYPESESHTYNGSVGLRQLIETGGAFSLNAIESRNKPVGSLSAPYPAYEQDVVFRFDHPILKGLGSTITKANIRIARNNKDIAFEDWRQTVMSEVAGVMSLYWDLVGAVNKARVTVLSIRQAENLLAVNMAYAEEGMGVPQDIAQSRSQVARWNGQLISEMQQINNLQDELKRRLRLRPGHEMWNYTLLPLDEPLSIKSQMDPIEKCLEDAYTFRPEVASVRLQAENLAEQLRVRKNALLPDLSTFFQYGLIGWSHDYWRAKEDAAHSRHYSWGAGLEFSYPLQNRRARYQLKETQKSVEQIKLSFRSLLEDLASEVRASVRAVDSAYPRIQLSSQQIAFEYLKLQNEMLRYRTGVSPQQQVIEFQEDLAIARSNYLSAIIDYNKALIDLEWKRGTILQSHSINIAGDDAE